MFRPIAFSYKSMKRLDYKEQKVFSVIGEIVICLEALREQGLDNAGQNDRFL